MFRFVSLLLLSLSIAAVKAQQLTEMHIVGKAEFAPSELVDRSVLDANGKVCAGLIVISDLTGLSFSSNNGIVRVNSLPGRHFLFLSPDERVVDVYCAGFSPLKIILNEFDVRLETGKAWQIRITGKKDLVPITILTDPLDATVLLDGSDESASKTHRVLAGKHDLRVQKKGYRSYVDTITVSFDSLYFNVNLEKLDLVQVQIRSHPVGAQISIDGLEKGRTDKEIFLYPGIYLMKLSKSGFFDLEKPITVAEFEKNQFSYDLSRNSGVLRLNVTPKDATILINKEDFTDREEIDLAPGQYKVEVHKPGYVGRSESFEIARDSMVTKDFLLVPRTGVLQFTVEPSDVAVTLKQAGETISSWKGTKLLREIPAGDYDVWCARAGYMPQKKQIRIIEGQTCEVDMALAQFGGKFAALMSDSDMVLVTGGYFEMGSDDGSSDERPVHRVYVDSFYISIHEVTQKQWTDVMGVNASDFKGCEECPVEGVSWDDVQQFLEKLNMITGRHFRLPTEAEWEFAARGGTRSQGYSFSGSSSLEDVGWFASNASSRTHPVAQKKPNELGVYDMSGNVWEWCSDWYDENYYRNSGERNPAGPLSGTYRVLRGGSWYGGAQLCRVAVRFRYSPMHRMGFNGFGLRLAEN